MRYKFTWLLMACIIVLWHDSADVSYAAEQQARQVLLIYDSLAAGSEKEGNVDALKRLLGGMGAEVKTVAAEQYEPGTLKHYSYVIVMRNKAERMFDSDTLMHDLEQYKGSYMHIGSSPPQQVIEALGLELQEGPVETVNLVLDLFSGTITLDHNAALIASTASEVNTYGSVYSSYDKDNASPYGAKLGRFAYITFYNEGDISEWAASYLFKDWLGVQQQGSIYVMLREVYPFSDLDKLRELSDQLYEAGIPFIVSTKPLFSNFDYPAAERYAETTKYMQSRNGSILVDAPAVANTISADLSVLKQNMTSYIHFLAEHDVAPLGATAEMYWFQDQYYTAEGLSFYDSVIMLPNEKVMSYLPTDTVNAYPSSMYSMNVDQWQQYATKEQKIQSMPLDVVLTLNMLDDPEVLEQQIAWLAQSWTVFSDYKARNHRVTTEHDEIVAEQGQLKINGQVVVLQEAYASISSEHVYIEEQEASLEQLFTIQNKIFIVLIVVVLIIFSILIIIGYRMYRKKYVR